MATHPMDQLRAAITASTVGVETEDQPDSWAAKVNTHGPQSTIGTHVGTFFRADAEAVVSRLADLLGGNTRRVALCLHVDWTPQPPADLAALAAARERLDAVRAELAAAEAERTYLIRDALSAGVGASLVAWHAALTTARVYQIRDGKR